MKLIQNPPLFADLPSCLLYLRGDPGVGFKDWSPYHRTVTPIGNTSNSTVYTFFPPKSISSPASGGLSLGASSDFEIGTGPFTFSAYVNLGAGAISNAVTIFMRGATGYATWMDIDWESGAHGFELYIGGSYICGSSNTSPFTAGTPYHIYVNRSTANLVNLYINGTSVANTTSSANIHADPNGYSVGASAAGTAGIYGYMDEIALWRQYIPITALCPLLSAKGLGRRMIV